MNHAFWSFPMVLLWFCYGFLWFSYGFPMVSYGFPMVFLWFSYGFAMVLLWFCYGFAMVWGIPFNRLKMFKGTPMAMAKPPDPLKRLRRNALPRPVAAHHLSAIPTWLATRRNKGSKRKNRDIQRTIHTYIHIYIYTYNYVYIYIYVYM